MARSAGTTAADPSPSGPRLSAPWALALVALLALAIVRLATEDSPPLRIQRTLAAFVRVPGAAPTLDWPRAGEAAVEVEGVGSFGVSGAQAPVPIASVAKVMTAYLILREHPLGPGEHGFAITISAADAEEQEARAALGESTLPVTAGERLSERQALEALLLPSANNVAALLARHDAGSVPAFVARMNAAARRFHMSRTHYTDPSGFEDGTVSTAADQLRLARAAMGDPAFAAIVAQPSAELPGAGRVANYNTLAGRDGYVGVKTGSDRAAGGCLVFAKEATVDGHRLQILGVVLGQREGPLIEAAVASGRRLGDSAAAAARPATVLPAGTPVLSAHAADGRGTVAVTASALGGIGWGGLALPAQVILSPPQRSVSFGAALATVALGVTPLGSSRALATSPVSGPSLRWRLEHLL